MKKNWILLVALVAIVAIGAMVVIPNYKGDDTLQGELAIQGLTPAEMELNIILQEHALPLYEHLSEWISPEGFQHELFVLRFATPRNLAVQVTNTVYYDVPQYDGQPLPEGFSLVDKTQDPDTDGSKTE